MSSKPLPNPPPQLPQPQPQGNRLPTEINLTLTALNSIEFIDVSSSPSSSLISKDDPSRVLFHSKPSSDSTIDIYLSKTLEPRHYESDEPSLYNHLDLFNQTNDNNSEIKSSKPPIFYSITRSDPDLQGQDASPNASFTILGSSFWGLQNWSSPIEVDAGSLRGKTDEERKNRNEDGRDNWRIKLSFKGPDHRSYFWLAQNASGISASNSFKLSLHAFPSQAVLASYFPSSAASPSNSTSEPIGSLKVHDPPLEIDQAAQQAEEEKTLEIPILKVEGNPIRSDTISREWWDLHAENGASSSKLDPVERPKIQGHHRSRSAQNLFHSNSEFVDDLQTADRLGAGSQNQDSAAVDVGHSHSNRPTFGQIATIALNLLSLEHESLHNPHSVSNEEQEKDIKKGRRISDIGSKSLSKIDTQSIQNPHDDSYAQVPSFPSSRGFEHRSSVGTGLFPWSTGQHQFHSTSSSSTSPTSIQPSGDNPQSPTTPAQEAILKRAQALNAIAEKARLSKASNFASPSSASYSRIESLPSSLAQDKDTATQAVFGDSTFTLRSSSSESEAASSTQNHQMREMPERKFQGEEEMRKAEMELLAELERIKPQAQTKPVATHPTTGRRLTKKQTKRLEEMIHSRDESPMRDLPLLLISLTLCFEVLKDLQLIQPSIQKDTSSPIAQDSESVFSFQSSSKGSVTSSNSSYPPSTFSGSSSDSYVEGTQQYRDASAILAAISPVKTEKLSLLLAKHPSHPTDSQVSLPTSPTESSDYSPISPIGPQVVKRSPTSATAISVPMLIPFSLQRNDSTSSEISRNDSLSYTDSLRYSNPVYRRSRLAGSLVTTNPSEESDDSADEDQEGTEDEKGFNLYKFSDQPPRLDLDFTLGFGQQEEFASESFGEITSLVNEIMLARF